MKQKLRKKYLQFIAGIVIPTLNRILTIQGVTLLRVTQKLISPAKLNGFSIKLFPLLRIKIPPYLLKKPSALKSFIPELRQISAHLKTSNLELNNYIELNDISITVEK